MIALCGPCAAGQCTGLGRGGICEHRCHTDLREDRRRVTEELVTVAAPVADDIRELLDAAMASGDAEAIRREGSKWPGPIRSSILRLADRVDEYRKGS